MTTYLSIEEVSDITEQKSCGPQHEQQYIAVEKQKSTIVDINFILSFLLYKTSSVIEIVGLLVTESLV